MPHGQSLTVVVPAYNEEEVLNLFHGRLSSVLRSMSNYKCDIIFVNDGSTDNTQAIIEELCAVDAKAGFINLSRNFGKEIAMTAGLDHARGDFVAIIDADLQDPPELIPSMLAKALEGFDMVFARRTQRDGESMVKKFTAAAFYRLINQLSGKVNIPHDAGDYRIMSRRAVDALLQLREQHRFMKGLFAWVGYPSAAIEYRRDSRAAGNTKFDYWKLWNFALEGITSFTIGPLKVATYFGFLIALFAIVYGAWIIIRTLVYGESVQGFPTIMVTILFLGGFQLIFIGVIGEYLGRVFEESKQRPLYMVQTWQPARMQSDTVVDGTSPIFSELEDIFERPAILARQNAHR